MLARCYRKFNRSRTRASQGHVTDPVGSVLPSAGGQQQPCINHHGFTALLVSTHRRDVLYSFRIYCGTVLIGHSTGLARSSLRPSVRPSLTGSELENKNAVKFWCEHSLERCNWCANFQFQRSRLRSHSCRRTADIV